MKTEGRVRSMLAKKLEDAEFRKRFEEGYSAFELEIQMLNALERKKWSYEDLAKATGTSKSNISRDLKSRGILSATISRIARMADALGMKLISVLVPKEQVHFILPRILAIVQSSFNAAYGGPQATSLASSLGVQPMTTNATACFTLSQPMEAQTKFTLDPITKGA